jgi:hypothetical protein
LFIQTEESDYRWEYPAIFPCEPDMSCFTVQSKETLKKGYVKIHYRDPTDTQPCAPHLIVNDHVFMVQSEERDVAVATPVTHLDSIPEETDTTVQFTDSALGEKCVYAAPADPSFYATADETADIGRFLNRPVQIATYTWLESGFGETFFDPWTLFLSDTRVKKKIDNFMFMSMTLRVKFVINASPFYYGAMRACYQPLLDVPTTIGSNAGKFIPCSQQPGVWILPQDQATVELELPFFYYQDWIQLTAANKVNTLGRIRLLQYTTLASANGATSNGVTISVFAWAENVKLAGPTVALSLQSEEIFQLQSKDEYKSGPISGIASAIANAAGKLANVPTIGLYARATEIGFGAVASTARLFGYTNVPIVDDTMPLKNMPFTGFSSAHISEPTTKLSFDPKSELTLDPRTTGLGGDDELALTNIVTKESYLDIINWTTAQAADTLLLNMPVTPSLYQLDTFTGGAITSFTPMSHAAELFNNWRGDIVYRFKFICSKYHRGRVRFTWDPIGNIVTASGLTSTNVTYTKIVDIGEETDVTIRIPYLQAKKFLETRQASTLTGSAFKTWQLSGFSSFTTENIVPTRYNGQLTLRVLNTLSAPVDTAPITILMFASGAEDLQFANPISVDSGYSYFGIQSEEKLFQTTDDNHATEICYGETIPSLRVVLRRMNLLEIFPLDSIGSTAIYNSVTFKQKRIPQSPGYCGTQNLYTTQAKGINVPASNFNYNFCNFTAFSWIQGPYLGNRGSVKYAFNFVGASPQITSNLTVNRTTDTLPAGSAFVSVPNTVFVSNAQTQSSFAIGYNNGSEGIQLFNSQTQPGITWEAPNMINNRFALNLVSTQLGSTLDSTDRETYYSNIVVKPSQNQGLQALMKFVSIGTDFNFFFYINAPQVNWLSKNPRTVTPV